MPRRGLLRVTGEFHTDPPPTPDDRVRMYFRNAGPSLISSFRVIGEIFDRVYRQGDLVGRPARSIQSTLVPAGGATVVEFDLAVPGAPRPDVYDGFPPPGGH